MRLRQGIVAILVLVLVGAAPSSAAATPKHAAPELAKSHGKAAKKGRAAERKRARARARARREHRRSRHQREQLEHAQTATRPGPATYASPYKPPSSDLLFQDGFSNTGIIPPTWSIQRAAPERIQIVPSPGGKAPYAARFEVQPGDVAAAGNGTGNRAEMYARGWRDDYPDGLGTERWYGISILLPTDSPSSPSWQVLTQWKNEGAGSPPLSLNLDGERLSVTAITTYDTNRTSKVWQGPLNRGKWTRFVVHVKWSPDPAVGFIEVWRDGQQIVPLSHRATMFVYKEKILRNYLKVGYYRSSAIQFPQWMYAEDVRIGSSYEQVAG